MNVRAEVDRSMERFCRWLGRYGSWSRLLDGIAGAVCPAFVNPLLLPAAAGEQSPLSRPMFTKGADYPHGQPIVWDSKLGPAPPTRPDGGEAGDPPHSSKCSPMQYHGMHGAPCGLNLGNGDDNTMCPYGSEAGLWWRFNIPGLGNVYYVDCCGVDINWTVWCRWAKEINWCGGKGNQKYSCTLTILQKDMHVGSDGFADPQFFVPIGPPSTP